MITDQFLVTGKTAIVTGAGRGIGEATALALAEAGANVVISARSEDQLESVAKRIRSFGREAVSVPADLNDVSNMGLLVDTAADRLGGVDIVINNVGGSFPRPLLETSTNMFERAFHFNVTTAFELSKAAIPHMVAAGSGSIVNISSLAGRLPDRGFAAYGTAKAALTHLTREMAADCAPKIRVNAIAVGSTETSALESVLDDNIKKQMEDNTPLRRLGQPKDIALGALYLCSPAGSFITGKILEIDGGLEAPNLGLGLPDL